MRATNKICPFCGKGDVWELDWDEANGSDILYCRKCEKKFNMYTYNQILSIPPVSSSVIKTESVTQLCKHDKFALAVQTLDLFTKIFCVRENEEDLVFECLSCPFKTEKGICLVKEFKSKFNPNYKEFGSMGDL